MEIPNFARVCPHCGYRFSEQQIQQEKKEDADMTKKVWIFGPQIVGGMMFMVYHSTEEIFDLILAIICFVISVIAIIVGRKR